MKPEELQRIKDKWNSTFTLNSEECGLLIRTIEQYREALRFYANHETWESTSHDSTFDGIPCTDFQTFKTGWTAPYNMFVGCECGEKHGNE